MTEIDEALRHAFTLFREHVERYREDILVEPLAWRQRCQELHDNFQWILFCQAHPLPKAPKQLPPKHSPPPPFRG